MGFFENKVAVVTGSSIGIGKEIARQLVQDGAKVVLNGRDTPKLHYCCAELKKIGEVIAYNGDVSNLEDCDELMNLAVSRFGRIDILINNAGVSMEGEIERLSPSVLRKVMEVNFLGASFATQAALPFLRESKGSVVFVSSLAGLFGLPRFSVYSASKMALTGLAESLKAELDGSGVHVGIAYVGFTENDPLKQIYDANGQLVAQPNRKFSKPEPVEIVAARILRLIKKRRFKEVFTPLGKVLASLRWLAPNLLARLILSQYHKMYGGIAARWPSKDQERSTAA